MTLSQRSDDSSSSKKKSLYKSPISEGRRSILSSSARLKLRIAVSGFKPREENAEGNHKKEEPINMKRNSVPVYGNALGQIGSDSTQKS